MFIHKKTVIFIPYFDSPFCLINYWQNGGFFLKSEIPVEITTNVRLKEVEEAQQRIVNLIRKLEDAGEVIINKGGDDDNIVV